MSQIKFGTKPIIPTLRAYGIEVDQRLRDALALFGNEQIDDGGVFHALYRLNTIITRYFNISQEAVAGLTFGLPAEHKPISPEKVHLAFGDEITTQILNSAISNLQSKDTLGTRDFLRALMTYAFEKGDDYATRPFTVDLLTQSYFDDLGKPLSQSSELIRLLEALNRSIIGDEDYQFILTLNQNQVAFRIVSVLDDYIQQNNSGLLLPQRAMLVHFQNQFGSFTWDEIKELEDLLNSPMARESDFQRFFESHSHFLRKWDHREIYPQVTLARPEGPLIPDFILTDRELQRAAIVDLKLPNPKLIRRQRNRDRFASAIMEARTQLLRYRDWFRERENRTSLKQRLGMEIYEPHMVVIIGRSSEFKDEFDRQLLIADNPDIEVVTYDDILTFAKRRSLIIQG